MNPELTALGSASPVSLSSAKSSQRITGTDEDTTLQEILDSAITHAEKSTGYAFRENTYTLRLQGFSDSQFVNSGVIRIPISPLKSVTSIKHYDADDVLQTLTDGTDYEVNRFAEVGEIRSITSWPTCKSKFNSVEIVFVAGYSNAGLDTTPSDVLRGINMLFGKWDEHRSDYAGKRLPTGCENLFIRNKLMY